MTFNPITSFTVQIWPNNDKFIGVKLIEEHQRKGSVKKFRILFVTGGEGVMQVGEQLHSIMTALL